MAREWEGYTDKIDKIRQLLEKLGGVLAGSDLNGRVEKEYPYAWIYTVDHWTCYQFSTEEDARAAKNHIQEQTELFYSFHFYGGF